MYAAMVIAEAIRKAQELAGTPAVNAAQVRDGFEALDLTEARLAELGLPGFAQPITASCADHGGPGTAMIFQWDAAAKKWNAVSDWLAADHELIDPLIAGDSAAFAAENGIAERCN
jgi:branched-chain amino acid transport system substrate-binding protein